MSAADYYDDSSQWGSYQYVTLEEIVTNYMMSLDPDDYTATVSKYKVVYQAMRGLRELYYDVLREIKVIRLDLSPSLAVTLPPDYVNYARISWVDEAGHLHPMAVDDKMSIAKEYLQDHEYKILFDEAGCPLEDYTVPEAQTPSSETAYYEYSFQSNFIPNKNMSNYFPNGSYAVDKGEGVIRFSSDAQGKSIVLEYISDGLYLGCERASQEDIRIHKFAESTIMDYIHYELIKNRRNVPYNEKVRARKEYFNSRRITKLRINTVRKAELLQIFKGASKWIK